MYNPVTQNLGFVNLKGRCWIEVKGEDARKFLNGVLTNNIQALREKTGCYALLCTPKGKILSDFFCYAYEDYFGIDCDAALKPRILETLKKYIIFQKVSLEDQTEKWEACAIIGSKAAEFLQCFLKNLPTKELEYAFAEWNGLKLWVIRKKRWGLDGFELWLHREQLSELKAQFNLQEVTPDIQEILRIESATPLFGVDMDENTIPQEANLYSALSFNKGCYVGQEAIARLEHRGHVGKKLVLFKIEGNVPPPPGEKIFSDNGQEAGWITSSCISTKYNGVIALAYLKYQFLSKPLRHAHPL